MANRDRVAVDIDRAVDVAKLIVQYASEGRGVFALPYHELHPQVQLPDGIAEGTTDADVYRLIGAGVDRVNTSNPLWGRHRRFFSGQPLAERLYTEQLGLDGVLPSRHSKVFGRSFLNALPRSRPTDAAGWSPRQQGAYLEYVNAVLHNAKYGVDIPSWVRWYETEFDPALPASENKVTLQSRLGMGTHIAAIAIQYLYEARGKPLDEAFATKADLHDVRFALSARYVIPRGDLPHASDMERLVAEVNRQATNRAGIDKTTHKAATWAFMRYEFAEGIDLVPARERPVACALLVLKYPGIFPAQFERWVRRDGWYTLDHRTNASSLSSLRLL